VVDRAAVAFDEAGPAPSAAAAASAGSMAVLSPWSLSARGVRWRLPVRAWRTALARCLRPARLGAGPVPPPVELSPGIPFSDVTGP